MPQGRSKNSTTMSTRSRKKPDTKEDIIKKENVTEFVSVFYVIIFFIFLFYFLIFIQYYFGLLLRNVFLICFYYLLDFRNS